MAATIDCNQERRIITAAVAGILSSDVLQELLSDLDAATKTHPGCRLVLDLRATQLAYRQMDMTRIMDVVSAIAAMKDRLDGRIAHVVPNDRDRLAHSGNIGSVASIRGMDYRVFTDIDEALTWLG